MKEKFVGGSNHSQPQNGFPDKKRDFLVAVWENITSSLNLCKVICL